MTKQELLSLLNKPENLLLTDLDSLKDLVSKYPFCSVFQILLAKKMKLDDNHGFQKQLNLTATVVPDRKALFNYLKSPLKDVSFKTEETIDIQSEDTESTEETIEYQETDTSSITTDTEETSKYDQLIGGSTVAERIVRNAKAEKNSISAEDLTENKQEEDPEVEITDDQDSEDNIQQINDEEPAIEETVQAETTNQPAIEEESIELMEEESIEVVYEEVTIPEPEEEKIADTVESGLEDSNQEEPNIDEVIDLNDLMTDSPTETSGNLEYQENGMADIDPESVQPIPDDEILPIEIKEIPETEVSESEATEVLEEIHAEATEKEGKENVLDLTEVMTNEVNEDSSDTMASIHEIMFLSEIEIPYEESDTAINDSDQEEGLSFSDWLNKGKPISSPKSTDTDEEDSLPMIKVKKSKKKKMKKEKVKVSKSKKKESKKKVKATNKTKSKKNKKKQKEKKIKVIAKISVSKNEDIVAENLASILVAQGKLKEAKAMYKKLILKFPEKSTFFAQKLKDLKKKK